MHETWYFYSLLFYFIFHESKQTLILFPPPSFCPNNEWNLPKQFNCTPYQVGNNAVVKNAQKFQKKLDKNQNGMISLYIIFLFDEYSFQYDCPVVEAILDYAKANLVMFNIFIKVDKMV